ncbi:integrase core domain protein [Leptospira borgpetersenii serovar Ballum]|uniref:Integrase core domain protein n=1 Tax=Leptospira borgpetersenii serovar Ballum TaxID=280505 RepID=A0A0S2IXQ2_LEPBO|nr:integrase core domain protein [Leptospira borgpetersenii]ALO28409.1 integrase core domain protein [Leptospira borgpetersenii serovar Ballum]
MRRLLEYKTPEKIYMTSDRVFPIKIPEIAYATNIVVKTVLDDGTAKIRSNIESSFGSPLIGERVGFEEISERLCKIYFTNAVLGMLDLFTGKVLKYETSVYNYNESV